MITVIISLLIILTLLITIDFRIIFRLFGVTILSFADFAFGSYIISKYRNTGIVCMAIGLCFFLLSLDGIIFLSKEKAYYFRLLRKVQMFYPSDRFAYMPCLGGVSLFIYNSTFGEISIPLSLIARKKLQNWGDVKELFSCKYKPFHGYIFDSWAHLITFAIVWISINTAVICALFTLYRRNIQSITGSSYIIIALVLLFNTLAIYFAYCLNYSPEYPIASAVLVRSNFRTTRKSILYKDQLQSQVIGNDGNQGRFETAEKVVNNDKQK